MALTLPRTVASTLTKQQKAKARAWWATLNAQAKAEFVELWDGRTDDTSLYGERQADGSVEWMPLPVELRGLIIEGRADERASSWNEELYEYLVSHPEAVVVVAGRAFHVCRAHAEARAVLFRGELEGDFSCPLQRSECPMVTLCRAAGHRRLFLCPR